MKLPHNTSFEAIGTQWHIATLQKISPHLLHQISTRIETYDKTYSRFKSDSLISKIAKEEGEYLFPEDIVPIIEFYHDLYVYTRGKVTPLIGSMLERAGYDAQYSFEAKPQERLPQWDEALIWNGRKLRTTRPLTLDIGAAGKGYLVDIVSNILNRAFITDYVIDASGDLLHKGTSENRVGLEHPLDPTRVIGVADVRNKSLCASATTRRAWGTNMHHIFDPDTRSPVRGILATWVVANKAMVADGIATALFFVEPKLLASHFDFNYVRMFENGSIDYSRSFEGELF